MPEALLEPEATSSSAIAGAARSRRPSTPDLRLLPPEAFLVLLRPGHPLAEGELTLDRFTAFPHLLHSPNRGSADGALDEPLRAAGFPRRIGAVVAHLSAGAGRS